MGHAANTTLLARGLIAWKRKRKRGFAIKQEVPSNPGAFEELSKEWEVWMFEKALDCGARGGRGTRRGRHRAQTFSRPTLHSLFLFPFFLKLFDFFSLLIFFLSLTHTRTFWGQQEFSYSLSKAPVLYHGMAFPTPCCRAAHGSSSMIQALLMHDTQTIFLRKYLGSLKSSG